MLASLIFIEYSSSKEWPGERIAQKIEEILYETGFSLC